MLHRSIVFGLALGLIPCAASAQRLTDEAREGPRLGLATLAPPMPLDFRLDPAAPLLFEAMSFADWVGPWVRKVTTGLERARAESLGQRFAAGQTVSDTIAYMPPPPLTREQRAAQAAQEADLLGGTIGQYADLGMRVTGLGELGGSWQRYQPCDPGLRLNCNPGLFPQLSPEVEFGVQVAGTISDRIHVNVDYDQRREDFSAANNINVFYQGLQDEILQRVEVGDVAIRLPPSRYLTQGVPAGNFGFAAGGQLGPIDFQTVFAQQRGDVSTREFRLAGGGTEGLVQDELISLDDVDWVSGQFFLLVNPTRLRGSPHVDLLQLIAGDAPADVRPEQDGTVQLYRDERISATSTQQAQLGIFLADALSENRVLRHTGLFRRLVPGEDYIVHSSGLWIALRSPLRPDEALAVTYVTESGDTVGAFNAEQARPGQTPVLRLLRSPVSTHQPGGATWDFELHNIYRVNASSGVELSSLDVRISLGDPSAGLTFKRGPSGQVTFLRLFGLDDDAPTDAVDQANLWQPARDDFASAGTNPPVNGTFLVFPTLEPFRRPPPVPVAGLDAAAALALLGTDANDAIYTRTDPVARESSARFRVTFRYRVRVEGLISTFSLGQFGIRENTERLSIGGRQLARGIDYTIDYELGIVTLTDPQGVFGGDPNAEIRATWEQRSLFQVAPTSVFGAAATYNLGGAGTLNFVGIFQSEKTLYTRPQLGVEPGSIFLGGASANLRFDAAPFDRVLEAIPGLRTTGASALTLNGEVALSAPNPNRRGAAFLDDFEATDEFGLDLRRQQWRLASRPGSTEGDEGTLPLPSAANAARLIWQHDIAQGGNVSGSLLPQRDIDRQINVAGNAVPEPALWMTFGRSGIPAGERRWRGITTVLSTTGRDMTRSEFLEFYVSAGGAQPLALVIDIGTVGEDAFYVDEAGQTTGVYNDGQRWGLGLLDEEASLAQREIWGPDKDARGLWNQACSADPLQAYPLGDERSNCTRGNGLADTEDLDGNGILEAEDGAYFRYVVTLDQLSRYLVRDTAATGTGFRLYRIPLRDGMAINGATDASWRFVKHLRVTIAGEPAGVKNLVLARVRVIGSRWTKRDVHGVLSGLLSDEVGAGAASTEVRVGPVSRLTDGAQYASPPGVRDQLQDPTTQFGGSGVEFNEKSLRLAYDGLLPGERAEVYLRYPQQPRNFMTYRQLRLWALPRTGTWGRPDGERLLVRVGTDPRNYYLFQTTLRPATGDRAATPTDWAPEVTIDFSRWFDLKAEAEQRLLDRGPGAALDTVWSADSAYAVVLEDRARAPNLAAVRELVFAVYNGGGVTTDGEIWINELRVAGPLTDPGGAGDITLALTGDFLDASVGYANRGSLFRQLGETPGYRTSGDLSVNATARLDRFLPSAWGVDAPLSVSHTSSSIDPEFLEQSDVRADRLPSLRETSAGQTRVGLRVAKRLPSASALGRVLLDPVAVRIGFSSANTRTVTSRAETSGVEGGLDYRYDMSARSFDAIPGFLESALRTLAPEPVENSAAFERLVGARFRWTPERIGFGVSYFDREDRAFRFDRILQSDRDSVIVPIESPRRGLENRAELNLRPFDPVTAGFSLRSARDLLEPERATTRDREREALRTARSGFGGLDLGWEVDRNFGTSLGFRPQIVDWLRVSWTWNNRYGTSRNPAFLELLVEGEDTTAVMQRRFGSDRQIARRVDFQPSGMIRSALGPRADSIGGIGGTLLRTVGALQNISLTWNGGLSSQYERETFEPGIGYRLGFGDLESFRVIEGDTAVQSLARQDLRVTSTLALPSAGQLNVGYQKTRSEGFDIRGGRREQETTGWPNLRLGWRRIPMPGPLGKIFLGASASAGWEHVERINLFGRSANQQRTADEDRFPLELSLTLPRGVTASYSGSITVGESTDPTGRAEQDRANHSLRVAGVFQPPGFLRPRISQPIQTMLLLSSDVQRQCRFRLQPDQASQCVPFIDATTRTVNLTIDTNLSDLLVGVRLSWTDRQSQVGTRSGSSQFQLALFGQFNFSAGQMPVGAIR